MRRSLQVTVPDEPQYERDKGKTFELTEMDAEAAEAWAYRALSAMARSNVDLPPEVAEAGWGAVALLGLRAVLSAEYAEVAPLLAEMMACVQIVMPKATRALVKDDIEEVPTRLLLRDEVFKLHANFSLRERLFEVGKASSRGHANTDSSVTPISIPA
jgi:hypothetical protein